MNVDTEIGCAILSTILTRQEQIALLEINRFFIKRGNVRQRAKAKTNVEVFTKCLELSK